MNKNFPITSILHRSMSVSVYKHIHRLNKSSYLWFSDTVEVLWSILLVLQQWFSVGSLIPLENTGVYNS